MEERIRKMLEEVSKRVVTEVPECDDFAEVEVTSDIVSATKTSFVKIKVIPPPKGIPNEKIWRGVELQVGNDKSPYLNSRLFAVGTKQELLDKLASSEFLSKIVKAIPEMEESLRDV